MRLLRRLFALLIPAFFFFATTSLVSLDPFVASGEYVRAMARASDCSVSYFPAFDETDRTVARSGREILPGVRLAYAGSDLAFLYRAARTRAGTVRDDAAAYDWLGNDATTTRIESYETERIATTTASYRDPATGGCTRIIVSVNPAVLPVGIRGGSGIETKGRWRGYIPHPPKGWQNPIRTEPVDPAEHRGEVIIRVYENGQLVPNREVFVHTDARGIPGRYGRTYPHRHLLQGSATTLVPTIRIQGQRAYGQEVKVITDGHGEARFWVQPGYRGGPEAIIARTATIPAQAARAVVVRHKFFRPFEEVFGYTAMTPPVPSPGFPFNMVGYTDRHPWNHFIQGDQAGIIRDVLKAVWDYDPYRPKYNDGQAYWNLNDMSLEYGGAFKTESTDCSDPNMPSHWNHDTGLDFDVSPCWSTGPGGRQPVSGSMCKSGKYQKIDERTLAEWVIGHAGGAILDEGNHFHLRFPSAF